MSVTLAGMHADGVRVQVSSVDVELLAIVGTIRGVTPLAASGRGGPGTASIRSVAGSPIGLQFQAPGSSTWGAITFAPATGDYLLEDGADPQKWLRVHVDLTWLSPTVEQGSVYLRDRWNELGPDDVATADAAAGIVEVLTLGLKNASPDTVWNLKAWLGSSHAGLALSPDNVTFTSPTNEGTAVALTSPLAKGASVPLYMKRTITAGASPAAAILNQLELSWDGL